MQSDRSLKRNIPQIALALTLSFLALPTQAGLLQSLQALSPSAVPASDLKLDKEADQKNVEDNIIKSSMEAMNTVAKKRSYGGEVRFYFTAEAKRQDSVNTPTHSDIKASYTDQGLVLEYIYDAQALTNPKQLIVDMAFLKFVTNTPAPKGSIFGNSMSAGNSLDSSGLEFTSPHALAELIFNVENGSPTAAVRMIEYQLKSLKDLIAGIGMPPGIEIDSFVKETAELKKQELANMKIKAQAYTRKQEKALKEWKEKYQAQEKYEAMEAKLNDLILNNDRKAVARMIEAYLPWPVMEPFEIQSWKTWISAIENPDTKNTTVAFRGIDYKTDKVQRKQTPQGEAIGFMSTILTKNQGSYTRRLRSLATNREANGDVGVALKQYENVSVKIFDQLLNHANDPKASNFLSFTYDPQMASYYVGKEKTEMIGSRSQTTLNGGLLAVKMDSRRLVPNIVSMYSNEIELLAPLIVFPDEVVKYVETRAQDKTALIEFVQDVSQITGLDLSKSADSFLDLSKSADSIAKIDKFNRDGYKFFENISEQMPASKQNYGKAVCAKIF